MVVPVVAITVVYLLLNTDVHFCVPMSRSLFPNDKVVSQFSQFGFQLSFGIYSLEAVGLRWYCPDLTNSTTAPVHILSTNTYGFLLSKTSMMLISALYQIWACEYFCYVRKITNLQLEGTPSATAYP
jgi:hypothetical protein